MHTSHVSTSPVNMLAIAAVFVATLAFLGHLVMMIRVLGWTVYDGP